MKGIRHLRAMGTEISACGDRHGNFTYVVSQANCPNCTGAAIVKQAETIARLAAHE